ncbi:MAG: glycolate oxidase subunit GlcF [Gammaproteobacteria bacterium]|nr:glycolate oxidase subunit GlcF [Gammaproteobacteria bacterium]
MQTRFTPDQLTRPAMASSNEELRACLQCGYCIANCPTYRILGDELDSSRGRIYLIKEMLENGRKPDRETVKHLDRCLSCLACMATCPSSVHYMHLMDHAREHIEETYRRPLFDRMLRGVLAQILPYPGRLRLAVRAARLIKSLAFAMPSKIRGMLEFLPNELPPASPNDTPQIFPASGERRRRVALLTGCVQTVLDTNINEATLRILRRHGCEVVVAQGAGCCGALTYHMGKTKQGRAMAANNIRAWMKEMNDKGLDAVVINTSGCGTVVKDYGYMFRNEDLARDAATISALAKDISEVLSDIELHYKVTPDLRVAYHATCSLQFGQRIRYTPRRLLKAAGFTVLEPRDSHSCCGAAGTYNLMQPDISAQLKEHKISVLERDRPDVIAAGNIGCMIQIGSGASVPVVHTVELLDWATGGPPPRALEGMVEVAAGEK